MQGVNQGAAVKMGSLQVLEWAGPHVKQYSVFSQDETVGLTGMSDEWEGEWRNLTGDLVKFVHLCLQMQLIVSDLSDGLRWGCLIQ